MNITEVHIKLVAENREHLLAFGSITLDNAFAVHDLKIVENAKGLRVAMPSRKLTDRCPGCGYKNHMRARFCNHCGIPLDENRPIQNCNGFGKCHADIVHPTNTAFRNFIERTVLQYYRNEARYSCQSDYMPFYDDHEVIT